MKKVTSWLLVFIAVNAILAISGFFWLNANLKPASEDQIEVELVIPKGKSATQIAFALKEKGLIRNPLAFKFYIQLTGRTKDIQAGEFLLSPNLSVSKLIDELSKGPVELWVTIPEGLRREEIVEKFIQGLQKQDTNANTFRQEFLSESSDLEGFLFPDTYLFPREASASMVVKKMKTTFDVKIVPLKENILKNDSTSDLKLKEIVILASIIERETKTEEERPVVSGILYNRMRIGMALQADATVQYALGTQRCSQKVTDCDWWTSPTKQDLEIDSPFNTYKHTGLPPGPIANPGISSLRAAVSPDDNDYLYYLHDSNGNIHYARSLEEHNANVQKYLNN